MVVNGRMWKEHGSECVGECVGECGKNMVVKVLVNVVRTWW